MSKPRKGRRKKESKKEEPVASSTAPYEVEIIPAALAVYRKLFQNMRDAEARGERSSSHHTTFRMVQDAIKNQIPRNPIDRSFGLAGPLSSFFRVKKGRMRICWAASSATRRVTILFISETLRKDGDANDPYVIFTKLALSGGFDKFLGSLGLPPPRALAASAGGYQLQ
jgi:hypothetical protein